MMIGEKATAPRLRLVAGEEHTSAERPTPLRTGLFAVFGVCVPFWAGLAWLIAAWA